MPQSIRRTQSSNAQASVLILDDDDLVRRTLKRVLEPEGYACWEARSAKEAAVVLAKHPVDVVVLDLELPDRHGLDWLEEYMGENPEGAVVVVTGSLEPELAQATMRAGAIAHLSKPYEVDDLRDRVADAVATQRGGSRMRMRAAPALDSMTSHSRILIERMVTATHLRDGETPSHVIRLREMSTLLARQLGMRDDRATAIGDAARLHDVGKIAIPDAILHKPGLLTDQEREIVEGHALLGAEILSDMGLPELALAERVARSHHERWDGYGYPDKLRGADCPIEARIVGIADVYDSLSHRRVYKAAWAPERVTAFIAENRGRMFEPRLTDAFLDLLPELTKIRLANPD